VVSSDAGIEPLRLLFALMFMALPSLQVKAADAVSTPASPPASGGAATIQTEHITGAGGTFPAPVYAKWAAAARSAIGVDVTYNAIGSGAGQEQIISRSIDFGASDAPMDDAQLSAAKLLQFPTVVGAVVVIVNLPRVRQGELKLTGETLAAIFAGKIGKWNDPRLQQVNPDVTLPNLPIEPIHRYEPSGTSFAFTSYLSAVSAAWKSSVGIGTKVNWPAGVGARGSDGVATAVNITRGAIAYVESIYAAENHLTTAQLRNRSGAFVEPTIASITAAAASADWNTPNFAVSLVDTDGAANWPIVTPTFVLLPKDPKDMTRSAAVMRFFDWAYKSGGAVAENLGYVQLPATVQDSVRATWRSQVSINDESIAK
jgi:phosphate transport system substrate-binding protein